MEPIHIQSFVAASPEKVWRQLLERPEVVLDALPVTAWPEPREERAPARLSVRWPIGGDAPATALEITLDPISAGTRVEVRHDGWPDGPGIEDVFAGHFAGWLQALAALGLLVESDKDARASTAQLSRTGRYFASVEVPASADAAFRALTDPRVLPQWSAGALSDAAVTDRIEGRYARWALSAAPGGAAREVVVILRPTPRGTHCALAEYGVTDRSASSRWPKMLEHLAQFLR